MVTARLMLDGAHAEVAASGSVTAGIWLQLDGVDFPGTHWDDFAVAVLSAWVDASIRLIRGASRQQVRFMDGPYGVDITSTSTRGWRLELVEEQWSERVLRQTALVDPAPFLKSLVLAAETMLALCRVHGWENDDSTRLAHSLADLRSWTSTLN